MCVLIILKHLLVTIQIPTTALGYQFLHSFPTEKEDNKEACVNL